jgi:hypothetical protein
MELCSSSYTASLFVSLSTLIKGGGGGGGGGGKSNVFEERKKERNRYPKL